MPKTPILGPLMAKAAASTARGMQLPGRLSVVDRALNPAKVVMAMAATNRATAEKKSTNRLFERDFAHGFGAEDFADVESFHRGGAALVFRAHHLLNDRVHLVAQTVQRGHIRVLHHDEDAEVPRRRGVAVQDLVIENDLLLFLFVVN